MTGSFVSIFVQIKVTLRKRGKTEKKEKGNLQNPQRQQERPIEKIDIRQCQDFSVRKKCKEHFMHHH